LFTCQKYDFLIEKNLPSLPASRLNDLLPTGRSSPTTQNQENSGTTLPKGRVVGRKFHRGFVGIPTDLSLDSSHCGALRKCDTLVSLKQRTVNLNINPAV
uniref:hypothetical protein n=1 Tax=Leptospira weilii TaxID=28184 RepID=UPI000773F9C4